MTVKKQARSFRMRFHRAVMLSATLSIASLGGSIASCAATQKPDRIPVEEPAVFCYKTLGQVSCYSAPQPHMGNVVALPADPPHMRPTSKNEPQPTPAVAPASAPEPAEPPLPAPKNSPDGDKRPIPIKPVPDA